MSLVAGKDWVLNVQNGGIWKPYACARSGNFSLNTSMIETTGPGDGDYMSFKPAVHDFTAQIDGVCSLNESSNLTEADLLQLQLAKTKILCRFLQTSQDGNTYLKQAYFYLQSYTDTGSFDGVATFSISLRGTGLLTITFTPPTPPTPGDMRYPEQGSTAPATPGSYTWSLPGLIPTNTNLTSVVKDGRGQSDIILTGTPVGNEVLFEEDPSSPGNGLLTFAVPFEDIETPPYITYNQI